MSEKIVIAGAGQAGAQAVISLRQLGFTGDITLIGEEAALPYQRPPLSKAYLKGEMEEERLYFRLQDFYDQQNISVRTGVRVVSVDRADRTVVTGQGEHIAYDRLLLATGAPPRHLCVPGSDLEGLFYLRTLRDSDVLRSILETPGRVLIVGAGYIGLEVAAVARQAGCDVTIIEMADRVLARVASKPVSDFYEELHRSAGAEFRFGAAVTAFEGEGGQLTGAVLDDGETVPCTHGLIGIGAVPEVTLARDAGLHVENGIVVDDHARTSDPHIWAAGDCTNFPSARYDRRMRLESVPNAIEQAKVAAANISGGDSVYDPLPWFWSDQYDVKLQTVGLGEGHDRQVIRGSPADRRFSVWYLKGGVPLAVDAINDPGAFTLGKRLIAANKLVNVERLGDPETDLKSFL